MSCQCPVCCNGEECAAVLLRRIRKLRSENAKLRAALEEIKNPLNWCAYDDSGCAKWVGERVDDWCGCTHPIRIAEEALAPCDDSAKEKP